MISVISECYRQKLLLKGRLDTRLCLHPNFASLGIWNLVLLVRAEAIVFCSFLSILWYTFSIFPVEYTFSLSQFLHTEESTYFRWAIEARLEAKYRLFVICYIIVIRNGKTECLSVSYDYGYIYKCYLMTHVC